jgi:ribosomal protein L34E
VAASRIEPSDSEAAFYARSCKQTSALTPSRRLVNKGEEKGRGCSKMRPLLGYMRLRGVVLVPRPLTGKAGARSYAAKAESVSLQARSQRLQDSAHTRQCSMFISLAWYSHSSAHNRHASTQA